MFSLSLSRWFHLAAPIFLLVSGPSGLMCGVATAAPAVSAPMSECEQSMPGMPSGDSKPDKAGTGDAICRAPCLLVIGAVSAPADLAVVPQVAAPRSVRPLTGLRDPPDYPPPRDA
ncbi:hypothetical protein [Sphingomonas koreensis]